MRTHAQTVALRKRAHEANVTNRVWKTERRRWLKILREWHKHMTRRDTSVERKRMGVGNMWPTPNPDYAQRHAKWTRIHYEKVAAILARDPNGQRSREMAAEFAQMFAEDNPLFDSALFATACGLGKFERIT